MSLPYSTGPFVQAVTASEAVLANSVEDRVINFPLAFAQTPVVTAQLELNANINPILDLGVMIRTVSTASVTVRLRNGSGTNRTYIIHILAMEPT